MKRLLALLLAIMMVVLSACGNSSDSDDGSQGGGNAGNADGNVVVFDSTKEYVYKTAVVTLAANWNPHTVQTSDDSYPLDYITGQLYSFVFNDELNPVEGKDPYTGYKIIPEMAAGDPVDVTETVKAEHPEFNIPASATAGYAYTIDLNPNATWDNGDVINADTYIYSMQQLLDPKLKNYRAIDQYSGQLSIAGAEGYANSGSSVKKINSVDGENCAYTMADLVKGADGVYTTPEGYVCYFGLEEEGYGWMGGYALSTYYDAGYIPDEGCWSVLNGAADSDGYVKLTDETIAALYSFTGSSTWGNEPEETLAYYMSYDYQYPVVDYSTVGFYKSGDYQITIVLDKALAGFNLYYYLAMNSSSWLVHPETYAACLKQNGDAWTSTYNTSAETSRSYGPYKITSYQASKHMRFERNENWYGYTDGKHIYVDPTDGKTYPMYQTTAIDTQVVEEQATRKLMFLKGELMTYGLGSEDFATYRNSEYAHSTPAETIFFLIFNGYLDAIQGREANDGFDQTKEDIETITLNSFRRAVAVTYDKELFASTISPSRSGGYGLIGNAYLYDAETGARYRDTDQAKQVLCDFYSVDTSKYATLDDAVASITGYDPEAAKELYKQAFDEAIAAGYITDNDGDGISDQTIRIEYALSADNDFMTTTVNYLNEKMTEVTKGTPFEGKIEFYKSAPYGSDWSNKIKQGLSDTVLGGWSGSVFDPFGLTDLYTNPSSQFDGKWFDATTVQMTFTVNGEEITTSLKNWSDALNGTTITVNGKDYCFGDGIADVETRLDILAAIEGKVLSTYNYIPMLQDASMALLSQQVYYVVDEYNPVMGRGGIAYLKYNYDETAWTEYVTAQGGELKY